MSIKLKIRDEKLIELDSGIKKYFKENFNIIEESVIYFNGDNFYLFEENDNLPFLLYHGTSEFMIEFFKKNKSKGFGDIEFLKEFNKKIIDILLELHKICKEYSIETKYVLEIKSIMEKSESFDYNNFFITNSIYRAKNYALNGVGELLNATLDCYNSIKEHGVEYRFKDRDLEYIMDSIKNIKREDLKPVVVIFNNLKWSNISCYENGEKVNIEILTKCLYPFSKEYSFRYLGPVIKYEDVTIVSISEIDQTVDKLYQDFYKGYKVSLYENLKESLKDKLDSGIISLNIDINDKEKNILVIALITSISRVEVLNKIQSELGILRTVHLKKYIEFIIEVFLVSSINN